MSSLFKQYGWFLVIFLFYVYVTNPLNAQLPSNTALGFDSHIFAIIGYLWQRGYVPYRDIFDEKGPVIYVINTLGFFIHDDNLLGIYAVELVFLFFTLFFIFRTLKDDLLSVCASLFMLPTLCLMLFDNSEGGNMTEEYTALFAVLSVYLYSARRPTSDHLRLALYGVLGALAFLTKLNMAFMPLVMFMMELFRTRKPSSVLYCALGFTLATLPFVVYFYLKGALWDFYETYIVFNIFYLNHSGASIYQMLFPALQYHPALFACFAILLRLIYLHRPRRDFILSVLLLSLCLVLCVGSGKLWNHYFVIFLGPLLILLYFMPPIFRKTGITY